MKRQFITPLIVAAAVALGQAGCSSPGTPKRLAKAGSSKKEMTFPEDVAFLQKHVEVITLGQGEGQPQGRIGVELASGAERVHWSEVTPYIGHESSVIWPVGRMLGEDGAPSLIRPRSPARAWHVGAPMSVSR